MYIVHSSIAITYQFAPSVRILYSQSGNRLRSTLFRLFAPCTDPFTSLELLNCYLTLAMSHWVVAGLHIMLFIISTWVIEARRSGSQYTRARGRSSHVGRRSTSHIRWRSTSHIRWGSTSSHVRALPTWLWARCGQGLDSSLDMRYINIVFLAH